MGGVALSYLLARDGLLAAEAEAGGPLAGIGLTEFGLPVGSGFAAVYQPVHVWLFKALIAWSTAPSAPASACCQLAV